VGVQYCAMTAAYEWVRHRAGSKSTATCVQAHDGHPVIDGWATDIAASQVCWASGPEAAVVMSVRCHGVGQVCTTCLAEGGGRSQVVHAGLAQAMEGTCVDNCEETSAVTTCVVAPRSLPTAVCGELHSLEPAG
jgi:hypothetical protein